MATANDRRHTETDFGSGHSLISLRKDRGLRTIRSPLSGSRRVFLGDAEPLKDLKDRCDDRFCNAMRDFQNQLDDQKRHFQNRLDDLAL